VTSALIVFAVLFVVLAFALRSMPAKEESEEQGPAMGHEAVFLPIRGQVQHPRFVEELPPLTNEVYADNWDLPPDMPYALAKVLWALREVESDDDADAVGDLHLTNKAYGVLQIRKPYLDDAMRIAGPEAVRQEWGVDRLTMEDMRDTAKAWWVAEVYLKHYGERYERLTGREPTEDVYARIHNGGPDGWRKSSTNEHARKVSEVL